MNSIVVQNIKYLKSLPTQFPQCRFNYSRNKMGASSSALKGRMTHISSRRDPHISIPFDADDLSRCLWWIIDNPAYWGQANFLSISAASPEWKGIIVWLIPLIQKLMMTVTWIEEPALSKWVRQIMNDSVDPPPHQNMEEAREVIEVLKHQTNDNQVSFLEITQKKLEENSPNPTTLWWHTFQTKRSKLTNDLITIASQDEGNFSIVAKKDKNCIQVLLQEQNRWITKITYSPIKIYIYLQK